VFIFLNTQTHTYIDVYVCHHAGCALLIELQLPRRGPNNRECKQNEETNYSGSGSDTSGDKMPGKAYSG